MKVIRRLLCRIGWHEVARNAVRPGGHPFCPKCGTRVRPGAPAVKFFAHDPEAGGWFICDTEAEARAYTEESIRVNREEAVCQGEWPPGTELIAMGRVRLAGGDGAVQAYTVTHRARLAGSDGAGYECELVAVDAAGPDADKAGNWVECG